MGIILSGIRATKLSKNDAEPIIIIKKRFPWDCLYCHFGKLLVHLNLLMSLIFDQHTSVSQPLFNTPAYSVVHLIEFQSNP